MSASLYLAGAVTLAAALAWSALVIARTVVPALPKIQRALQGKGE